jgi:hypothetical protein
MPLIRLDEGVIEIRVGKVGQRDKNMKRQKIKDKRKVFFVSIGIALNRS